MAIDKANPEVLLRLLEISRELTRETGTARVLERILDSAIEFTGAERGFLCLYRPNAAGGGENLQIVEARNLDREGVLDAHRKLSQSIVQEVMKTGDALVSMDAGEDARLTESRSIAKMGIRSVACIPLVLHPDGVDDGEARQLIGCVYVDHRFRAAQFLDSDVELLQIFGAHASLAIRNASLLAMLEEKNAKLNSRLQDSAEKLHETESLLEDALADASGRHEVPGVVYASRAMHKVLGLVKRVADQDLPILISGESGTGKEVLARGVHRLSARASGPFVPVNCGAIAPELFESELFGHKRGAFTGADRDREGLVTAANGGTLFLDEVTELSLPHQVKLLRVLQEREVRRVGDSTTRKVDFRVLSACNKDLSEEVRAGRFREDLFYRLRVFHVELPPLRDRTEDIPLLAETFVSKHQALRGDTASDGPTIRPEVLGVLGNYTWPGNIRELENEIKRALALSGPEGVKVGDLSTHIVKAPKRADTWEAMSAGGRSLDDIVAMVEREVIREALVRFQGNKSQTAKHLGVSRNGLTLKMERLGLA